MIRPHRLSEESTFLGQACALCKQEFAVGDDIIICPEDGSRHHVHCWEANNNHCTAYGCTGQGVIGIEPARSLARPIGQPIRQRPPSRPRTIVQESSPPPRPRPAAARPIPGAPGSKVRTLPAGNFGCVRGCFIVFLILLILAVAAACAGVFLLADSWSQVDVYFVKLVALTQRA